MKTAVEFLVERLAENGILHSSDIEKAKEMEKQEIIDAFDCGIYDGGENVSHYNMNAEQYYNETFKNK